MRAWLLAATCVACAACDSGTKPGGTPTSDSGVTASADGIRWTQSPGTDDVATAVKAALTQAHADGRTLLVYVGAKWCEPCQRFHHAVEKGELDAAFPRLSILGFDADRDATVLGAAGYTSRLIPLFALPRDDGRASGKQIEGSVKGEAAVNEITPRLRNLISGS
jgi:thiol-disulfide isomerase/thioredoxin